MVAAKQKTEPVNPIGAIGIAWLVAALFGDELVGVAMFGFESDALLMSITQSWWWIYQAVIALVFAMISAFTDRRSSEIRRNQNDLGDNADHERD